METFPHQLPRMNLPRVAPAQLQTNAQTIKEIAKIDFFSLHLCGTKARTFQNLSYSLSAPDERQQDT
jgi:hypothetical protein